MYRILLALAIVIAPWVPPLDEFGGSTGDIGVYWAATRLFLRGVNPYDNTALTEEVRTIEPLLNAASPIYLPPHFFTFFAPLALLPFSVLVKVWLSLSLGLTLLSLHLLEILPLRRTWRHRILVLTMLTFPPLFLCLLKGQLSALLLAAVLLAEKLPPSRMLLRGMALGLTTFKPHLFLVYYLWLARRSLRGGELQLIFGFCLTVGVLSLPSVALYPSILHGMLERSGSSALHWFTPTIGAWLENATGIGAIRFLPLAVAAAIALLAPLGSTLNLRILALSLIASPYIWSYDLLLFLPLLLIPIRDGSRQHTVQKFFVAAFSLNLLFWVNTGGMQYDVWYPIAITLLYTGWTIATTRLSPGMTTTG